MKTKIFSTFAATALMMLGTACHEPEKLESNGDSRGILSMTAWMVSDDDSSENSFNAEIDYDNHTITVVFPLNYPRPSDNLFDEAWMGNVRLRASLATNATIEPGLTTMDLRKTNYITVTNAQMVKTQYAVKGEIRPSSECELLEIELADGIAGIVDNVNHRVYLTTAETLDPQTATYDVSYHATVEPDIAVEPFDFEAEEATITVVAQNGVDKQEYTFVKGIPDLLPYGIREGSHKLLWTKKWNEVGYTALATGDANQQTGIGVTEKYIVLNQRGVMQATLLNAKDGSIVPDKVFDMSGVIPAGENDNMTSDQAGNIIVVHKDGKNGTDLFKLWIFKGLDDPGTQVYKGYVYGAGTRISVYGDVTKDAVIVTALSGTSLSGYRWWIKDGVFNPKGEQFNLQGNIYGGDYGVSDYDIAPTSATDPGADYFAVFYGLVNAKRGPALYSGNNSVKAIGLPNTKKRAQADGGLNDAGNWIMNACDYVEFNNSKYFIHNSVNTFTWGENDMIFLLDVTSGDLEKEAVDMWFDGRGEDGLTHKGGLNINFNYGATANGYPGKGLAGTNNDVRLWVSKNGCFMYGYFLFANGSIGRFRVDCIQY